jgi:hypothetical protein
MEYSLTLGEVIGVRSWSWRKLSDGRLHLIGVTGYPWLPGRNTAYCDPSWLRRIFPRLQPLPHHNAPQDGCKCGFYGYFRPGSVTWNSDITGIVKGYGNVLLGPSGFRCQKAELLAIAPTRKIFWLENAFQLMEGPPGPLTWKKMRQLGSTYGVPVYRNLNELLTTHPISPGDQ